MLVRCFALLSEGGQGPWSSMTELSSPTSVNGLLGCSARVFGPPWRDSRVQGVVLISPLTLLRMPAGNAQVKTADGILEGLTERHNCVEGVAILRELAVVFLGLEFAFSKFKQEPNTQIVRQKEGSRDVSEKFCVGALWGGGCGEG